MSTEIKGLELRGLSIVGKKTFNSIPGLIQINELDFEVSTIPNGGNQDILLIGDRAGFNNKIEGDSGPRRAQYTSFSGSFYSMRNSGNSKYSINRTKAGWNNILRLQPFGIFTLFARNNNAATGYILKHAGNEANKFWLNVNSNGALRHTWRNSSNTEVNWGTGNSEVALTQAAHACDLVSYGASEATKMEMFINTVSKATRTTINTTGSEIADKTFTILETDNASAVSDLILLAVYDWTGYSKSQIDGFRADFNSIREEKYGSIF